MFIECWISIERVELVELLETYCQNKSVEGSMSCETPNPGL